MSKKKDKKMKNNTSNKSTYTNNFFDKNYKLLTFIPFILLLLSIGQITYQISTTGDFISKGVNLAGGTSMNINAPIDSHLLESELRSLYPNYDINVREITNAGIQSGIILETLVVEEEKRDEILSYISENHLTLTSDMYTVEVIGPSLGRQFFIQTFMALIFAFVLMSIIVFIYFRSPAPSLIVILSVLIDIIVTAAIVNILDLQLSTAGIAAFLMLIGYSVDTDILLSTKLLKGKGTYFQRFLEAFKTGSFMSLTTGAAVLTAILFTQSDVIRQIMIVVLIGLAVDYLTTWLQNAGMLRYYLEKRGVKDDK